MKIETDSVFVNLEADNNFDIFFLGQLHKDMEKFNPHTLVSSNDEKKFAKLSIKKEDFIAYLYQKVDK